MPPPLPILWKGDTSVHEQPGSPVIESANNGDSFTRTWRGPFAALRSLQISLRNNGTMDGLPITRSRLAPDGAGTTGPGTLTVTAEDGQSSGIAPPETMQEMEWTVVEKKLSAHERYKDITPETMSELEWLCTHGKGETLEDREWTAIYENLAEIEQEYVDKRLAGTESYMMFSPVARYTTPTADFITSGAGFRQTPPIPHASGYQWLKTADRSAKRGNQWERVQEWTGADKIDTDLYP
jgi:hypothetical protein